MDSVLNPTSFFDFNKAIVRDFTQRVCKGLNTEKEKAIALYYSVRDEFKYNPYTFSKGVNSLRASFCLENQQAYCIPKAVLLGASCRQMGIPARLGLADVKNHLSSPSLIEFLKTDVFTMHGYSEIFLSNKWVKCTPSFNKTLCEKMGVEPLEFDGETDSLFQRFNGPGEQYMEYLKDHGPFDDVPVEFIYSNFKKWYPHLISSGAPSP